MTDDPYTSLPKGFYRMIWDGKTNAEIRKRYDYGANRTTQLAMVCRQELKDFRAGCVGSIPCPFTPFTEKANNKQQPPEAT